ncbi:DDT domain-containing protein [Heterostelium album PN500]|uniref:DDT domain-containing protein n=1 Tax=Heterostelium pallidum (strain ATCC 26659 / Pp 5 / PN500) TaxID=670386 RepID=D3BN87_HETP5|nr:DDT domain-containing protein [Heterostelium album PN500]EFA76747.1 DDT domain-containing protein [Heterostelium album PN500]|eukprot:XP_020428879.1 DDT domain-containing protein [Heterostelium album PN500]
MPLLGKEHHELGKTKGKPNREYFMIRFTGELFKTYPDYIDCLESYRQRKWTCSITNKSNLTYEEALLSEKKAFDKVAKFSDVLYPHFLKLIQYKESTLDDLRDSIYDYLNEHYFVGEQVTFKAENTKYTGRILEVITDEDSDTSSSSYSSSSSYTSSSSYSDSSSDTEHKDKKKNDKDNKDNNTDNKHKDKSTDKEKDKDSNKDNEKEKEKEKEKSKDKESKDKNNNTTTTTTTTTTTSSSSSTTNGNTKKENGTSTTSSSSSKYSDSESDSDSSYTSSSSIDESKTKYLILVEGKGTKKLTVHIKDIM